MCIFNPKLEHRNVVQQGFGIWLIRQNDARLATPYITKAIVIAPTEKIAKLRLCRFAKRWTCWNDDDSDPPACHFERLSAIKIGDVQCREFDKLLRETMVHVPKGANEVAGCAVISCLVADTSYED